MNKLKKAILFLIFTALVIPYNSAFADNGTYRIFFKDKGDKEFFIGSELYLETLNSLSEKSLKRRLKTLAIENVISIEDAPLFEDYLIELEKFDAIILAKIKWENYCVIKLNDTAKIEEIKLLPFVKNTQKTSSKFEKLTNNLDSQSKFQAYQNSNQLINMISIDELNTNTYGKSIDILSKLNIEKVHSLGISGDSILIGFIDSGFRTKTSKALQSANIIAEYDFIYRDSISSNESQDRDDQDHHGTICLSLAVANMENEFIGGSPSSSVALAKTENLDYERRIEEDLFFEASEWLESLGVDIISASLGYFNFDSAEVAYEFEDLDGNSTLCSRAVNHAAKRGIFFSVAAGNNGPDTKTINSPADADSAFTVGAVDLNNIVAKFSSRGSDANGRIRPIISAPGKDLVLPNPAEGDLFIKSSGTSLATPLIASSAALILSAFPELSPAKVKSLLKNHSDNYEYPNNNIGYGVPDVYSAIIEYDIVISEMMSISSQSFQRIIFKISYKNDILSARIGIKANENSTAQIYDLKPYENNYYFFDLPKKFFTQDTLLLYVEATSTDNHTRRKPYFTNKYIPLIINQASTPFGLDNSSFQFNYINENASFIYPNIIERSSEAKLTVFLQEESPISLTIYDIFGKIISQDNYKSEIGVFNYNISTSRLSSGVYFIQINKKNSNEVIKFIIL